MFDFYDLLNLSAVDPFTQTSEYAVHVETDNFQSQSQQMKQNESRKLCPECGVEVISGSAFCRECRANLKN